MATVEQDRHTAIQSHWIRAFYLVFFMIAFGAGQSVLCLLAVVQFLWLMATGEPNHVLRRFGSSLARWFAEVVRFLSCASDDKPFPWKEWPAADPNSESVVTI
jgi:Domain of unknown function (DUF4389)